ncbi:MAG: helix-turn-helix domain-containing protein [Candidatus Nitrosocosmicus sp.]|jgi:DNA-binding CsgD family transcriptional regulator
MEILSKNEKKSLVIERYKEGKTYKEIAAIVRISPRDIGRIINEYSGEKTTIYSKSESSKAYALFLKGKTPVQVAIKLDLTYEEVKKYYIEYMDLQGMKSFGSVYNGYKDYMPSIFKIINKLKYGKITPQEFNRTFEIIDEARP